MRASVEIDSIINRALRQAIKLHKEIFLQTDNEIGGFYGQI